MSPIRVLVIDDDMTILEMLRLALSRAGFEVYPASHGDIGLRLFVEKKPDIAVVDIAMPGLDGYDLIKRMRSSPDVNARHTPIIVLTAYDQSAMQSYAQDLGVAMFLTKPVMPARLVQHIRTLTGGGAG
jgi:DNA-binding response OmpR family regulator